MDETQDLMTLTARWQALRDEVQLWADACGGYVNPETLRELDAVQAELAKNEQAAIDDACA